MSNIGYEAYESRAKLYFYINVIELSVSGNYSDNELGQLIKDYSSDMVFNDDGECVILLNDDISRIKNVKVFPSVSHSVISRVLYYVVDSNQYEYQKIGLKVSENQSVPTFYIYRDGKVIYVLNRELSSSSNYRIEFKFFYIPRNDEWKDGHDLSMFSNRFLYDCIKLASDRLIAEQSR